MQDQVFYPHNYQYNWKIKFLINLLDLKNLLNRDKSKGAISHLEKNDQIQNKIQKKSFSFKEKSQFLTRHSQRIGSVQWKRDNRDFDIWTIE